MVLNVMCYFFLRHGVHCKELHYTVSSGRSGGTGSDPPHPPGARMIIMIWRNYSLLCLHFLQRKKLAGHLNSYHSEIYLTQMLYRQPTGVSKMIYDHPFL